VTDKVVVLVTCANPREAKRIARAAVEARLAACVNVLAAPVHSVFRWKGKVAQAREVLLLMKTSRKKLAALRAAVECLHSYDVPEFIALPIHTGSKAYFAWLDESIAAPHAAKRKAERGGT